MAAHPITTRLNHLRVALVEATPVRRWQIGLVALGLALLAVGGLVLLADVAPGNYLGILVWFAGALVLHDGIIAPLVVAIGIGMRRVGKRIPLAVIIIVQGALFVGALVSALVVPEILKKQLGRANPTILPLDYAGNLGWFYLGLVVVTGLAIGGYLLVRYRAEMLQKARPFIDHD